MVFLLPLILMLGIAISIDEMTIHLKIHYADKISMVYKSEVGGLQVDSLFQKGYTYKICICTDTVPKQYLGGMITPPHARGVALFDIAERKNPMCYE